MTGGGGILNWTVDGYQLSFVESERGTGCGREGGGSVLDVLASGAMEPVQVSGNPVHRTVQEFIVS